MNWYHNPAAHNPPPRIEPDAETISKFESTPRCCRYGCSDCIEVSRNVSSGFALPTGSGRRIVHSPIVLHRV